MASPSQGAARFLRKANDSLIGLPDKDGTGVHLMVLRDGFPVDMRGFSVIRQDSHALQGCLWPRLSSCFW